LPGLKGLVKPGYGEALKLNRAYRQCHLCFSKMFVAAEARGAGSDAIVEVSATAICGADLPTDRPLVTMCESGPRAAAG